MGEAFIYMYVLGSGAAAGVATIVIAMYLLYRKINSKPVKKRGIV